MNWIANMSVVLDYVPWVMEKGPPLMLRSNHGPHLLSDIPSKVGSPVGD